ncbi:stage II sporulation protein M [soil metagenome]
MTSLDIDRFLTEHEPEWRRLDELVARASRAAGRMPAGEVEELVRLYQRVSTHLSHARTYLRDPALTARLTGLTGRAAAVIYGTRPRTVRAAGRFLADTFPAAVWYCRWFVVVSALLLCLPAAAVATWIATSPAALKVTGPEAVREAYVARDFADYYTARPSAEFASAVTTNNIQVGILAFAGGVVVCAPTALVLAYNGANLGVAAGLFAAAGRQPLFWGLVLPHGLLELSAVCVAGAAGLRLGWTLVDPGDRARAEALVDEGRRVVVVVVGLAGVFAVAGLIEGFVTGSGLPTWARVGVGVLAEAAFVAYVVGRGRAAAAHGLTGALGEDGAGS